MSAMQTDFSSLPSTRSHMMLGSPSKLTPGADQHIIICTIPTCVRDHFTTMNQLKKYLFPPQNILMPPPPSITSLSSWRFRPPYVARELNTYTHRNERDMCFMYAHKQNHIGKKNPYVNPSLSLFSLLFYGYDSKKYSHVLG